MGIEDKNEGYLRTHSQLFYDHQYERSVVRDDIDDITSEHYHDHNNKPVIVKLNVSGREMYFEVNTSRVITIMSEDVYQDYFSKQKLQKPYKGIEACSEERCTVLGSLNVSVSYNKSTYPDMKLYVTCGSGINVIGRDWLHVLKSNTDGIFEYEKNEISKHISNNISEELKAVIFKFGTVFTDELKPIRKIRIKISIRHGAEPKFYMSRNLSLERRKMVQDEIDRMEEEGILKSVRSSEWASPLLIIPQTDGKIKICGDYRCTINPIIEREALPVLTLDYLLSKLQGGKRFSKIDLSQAYSQVEVHKDSRKYLIINTCKGLKEFTRIPDGIKFATGILQRHITKALSGIERIVVKIDEIIVTGTDDEDHLKNLVKVCKILEQMGATVNMKKCSFFAPQTEYLGFIIDKNGMRIDPKKVSAVVEMPEPTFVKELQSFMNGVHYYVNLIGNISNIADPLHRLLERGSSWRWTTQEMVAFETLKLCLSRHPVLCTYDPQLPLILACGASDHGLGAVLSHIYHDQSEKPIVFASRPLNKDEENLCEIYISGASIMFGLKEFNQYILGRKFAISTDNKTIRKIFDPKTALSPYAPDYLIRWSLVLNQYEYSIQLKQTKDHCNANMLSRLPVSKASNQLLASYNWQIGSLPVPIEVIRNETKKDDVLKHVVRFLKEEQWPNFVSEVLKPYYDKGHELFVKDEVVLWGLRVVVPYSLQATILKELHVQHPGIVRMKALSLVHVWYPGIDKHIERIVKDCVTCVGVANVTRRDFIHPWTAPTKAMDKVHIEYFEHKQNMYLMMVDSFSKMIDVKVMYVIDCDSTITCLTSWFFKYGRPKQLLTNNQPQFESSVFATFMQMNNVQHIRRLSCEQSGEVGYYVQAVKRGLNLSTNKKGNAQDKVDKFLISYLNSLLKV